MEQAAGRGRANLSRLGSEREHVCRQIDRLVDALADREPAARLTDELKDLKRRRRSVAARSRSCIPPSKPRTRVPCRSLSAASSRRSYRALTTVASGLRSAANWPRSCGFRNANARTPAETPEPLDEQIKLVAGARYDLNRTIVLYRPRPEPRVSLV
jgi:hypothetical protein